MIDNLHLEPGAQRWIDLVRTRCSWSWHDKSVTDWQKQTRKELNLEVNKLIIGTGHQSEIWHPGILVKYLMASELAKTLGNDAAKSLHLVVDQDVHQFNKLDVPVIDAKGLPASRTIEIFNRQPYTLTGEISAGKTIEITDTINWAGDFAEAGFKKIINSLDFHADALNASDQIANSLSDLMQQWTGSMDLIFSKNLLETGFGKEVVNAMREHFHNCAQTYNQAVLLYGEAGILPLEIDVHDVELPLWRITEDGKRVKVFASELNSDALDISHLRPRALLMTALVRLVVCDLFIHGKGGTRYDMVMETWIEAWLGLTPAPMAIASVDLTLPFQIEGSRVIELESAITQFRQLWHDPVRIDGNSMSENKKSLIQAIAGFPRQSRERYKAFADLHSWLEIERMQQSSAINNAKENVELAKRAFIATDIINRRDWPFPLYPTEMIDELAACCRKRLNHSEKVISSCN